MRSKQTLLKTLVFSLALCSAFAITACNKGNNSSSTDGNQPQIADVPSPSINGCFQTASASSWWQTYNVQAYPMNGNGPQHYQGAFAQGFCGCPAGTMPTCSNQGLLCLPVQHMNMNVATWSWNMGPNRGQFSPKYRCMNPYSAYDRYHRRGRTIYSRENGSFFYEYGYSYSYRTLTTYPGNPQPNPQPMPNPHPQPQYPAGGVCTSSVAQLCTPNPTAPMIPGQMYCQPLQSGNYSGPGIWVRL